MENQKSAIENLIDEYLKGLMLPQSQTVDTFPLWLLFVAGFVLLSLVILTVILWYRRRNSPQQTAKRQLKRLQGFIGKHGSSQNLAIQLASHLRQGLQITRLELYQPRTQHPRAKTQWQLFLQQLDAASYSRKAIGAAELDALFKQSYVWLKQA